MIQCRQRTRKGLPASKTGTCPPPRTEVVVGLSGVLITDDKFEFAVGKVDGVSILQHTPRDAVEVDIGAVTAVQVLDDELLIGDHDLGMVRAHPRVVDLDVVGGRTTDCQLTAIERIFADLYASFSQNDEFAHDLLRRLSPVKL